MPSPRHKMKILTRKLSKVRRKTLKVRRKMIFLRVFFIFLRRKFIFPLEEKTREGVGVCEFRDIW